MSPRSFAAQAEINETIDRTQALSHNLSDVLVKLRDVLTRIETMKPQEESSG